MTVMDLKRLSIDQLLDRFAKIGIAQDEALLDDNYAKYNRLYGQMNEVDQELRARGDDARLALLRLFNHPNIQVRMKAAARSLAVAPDEARAMLETIAASGHFPQAGHAGMLLAGLNKGRFKPT